MTKRALAEGKPSPSELDVWCDVARSKKGKVYGLGMKSTVMATSPCYNCSSSSSREWVKKHEKCLSVRIPEIRKLIFVINFYPSSFFF